MHAKADEERKKELLLSWSKAGGTKANLPLLCKKVLTVSSEEKLGGNVGYMTPGRVAELSRIGREMYPNIDEWQAALEDHIKANQDLHRASWPQGVTDMLQGRDYWASSFYYTHIKDMSWNKTKKHEDQYVREADVNKGSVDQLASDLEVASTVEVEEVAPNPVPEVSPADLQRGKQVANKLKKVGELLGKTSAMILMGELSDEASVACKKVEKAFIKARGAAKEHYQKDDFKEFMGGLDGLVEMLSNAVPSLPTGGATRGKKRTAACLESGGGKDARMEAIEQEQHLELQIQQEEQQQEPVQQPECLEEQQHQELQQDD